MECSFYQRNIQYLLTDGKTLHERYDLTFRVSIVPFGAVFFYPTVTDAKSRLHQLNSKVLKSNFHWICLECGERLDGRPSRGRCGRSERPHCIRSPRQKIRRKRMVLSKKARVRAVKPDEAVPNNSSRPRRDRSCKDSQGRQRSQDGACRLEPEKETHAVAWNTIQTRVTEMLACGCARTRLSRNTQVSYKKTQK